MASVLSYPDAAAEVMEHECAHSSHGYSQINRQGVGTGATSFEQITLSDGTGLRIATGDRDCSSASIECYAVLGVDCGGASYTGNMRECMIGTGNFKWISGYSPSKVRRGDILLAEGRHAAVALGNGRLGQFSISENGTTHGRRGDQTGYESNIKALYNYPWDGILRYCGPARAGSEAPSEGVAVPPTEATGGIDLGDTRYWGPKVSTIAQQQVGTKADGIISRQPKENEKYALNCETSSWRFTDDVVSSTGYKGSAFVRKIQAKLKGLGFYGGEIDGFAGKQTFTSIQKWLESKGYSVGEHGCNGYWGEDSNRAWCRALIDGAVKELA